MKTPQKNSSAFTLIEMLVYISVLFVVVGVGFTALYRCMDTSTALHRSSGDIVDTLHAGENWRADVRAVSGKIQLQSGDAEQILRLPGPRGEVSYRFTSNSVSRRLGNNEWSEVLGNVKRSAFVEESRKNTIAWRWELELQPRTKRLSMIAPLFTFLAAPAGDLPK